MIAKVGLAAIGAGVLWQVPDQLRNLREGHPERNSLSPARGAIFTIMGVWGLVALVSLVWSWPGPAGWLTAWTDLVAKAASAAIAARVLWEAPGQLLGLLAATRPRERESLTVP